MVGGASTIPWYDRIIQQCRDLTYAPTIVEWPESSAPSAALLRQLNDAKGPILLIDLLAMEESLGAEAGMVDDTIAMTTRRAQLAQALVSLQQRLQWLALVPSAGWAHEPNNASAPAALRAGATAGAIKSLGQEWQMWTRVLYFDVAAAPASWLKAEILDSAHTPEIHYIDECRWTSGLLPADVVSATARSFPANPVFVITGGGLGITATIAGQVAALLGPFRALILGRTQRASAAEIDVLNDPAAARKMVRQRLGSDATPRQVQEALQQDLRRAQLERGLQLLEAVGIEILYVPTDVQEAEEVQEAVKQAIDKWGQIDGVIHGAGIDKSRDLIHKESREIDLVMGVKLRGLQHLIAALEGQPIQCWLGFGSVSARFGNRGQFDYAAANEALARWLCASFGQGLIVDFTAWDEIGMAASLASMMKERGVDMLPPHTAAFHTVQLMIQGHRGEWVFSGRLPAMQQDTPLLGETQQHIPGALLQTTRQLSTQQHRYLQDHQIQGAEIMPGVVSLMTMREAASQSLWGATITHSTDIQFAKAIKLWPQHPLALNVEAALVQEPNGPIIATSLCSSRERRGVMESTLHATAIFHPGPSYNESTKDLPPDAMEANTTLEAPEIYRSFFHGPCWQVAALASINNDTCHATSPPLEGVLGQDLPENLRWEAVGLELLLQAAGLWVLQIPQQFALPFGIERWTHHASPTPGSSIHAYIQPTAKRGDLYLFDGVLRSADNQPLQQVTGLQMRVFPM